MNHCTISAYIIHTDYENKDTAYINENAKDGYFGDRKGRG